MLYVSDLLSCFDDQIDYGDTFLIKEMTISDYETDKKVVINNEGDTKFKLALSKRLKEKFGFLPLGADYRRTRSSINFDMSVRLRKVDLMLSEILEIERVEYIDHPMSEKIAYDGVDLSYLIYDNVDGLIPISVVLQNNNNIDLDLENKRLSILFSPSRFVFANRVNYRILDVNKFKLLVSKLKVLS